MKAQVLVVIAATILLAVAAHAQTMGEYGGIAVQSSKVLTAPSPPSSPPPLPGTPSTGEKSANATAAKPAPRGPVVWEAKNTTVKDQAPPKPAVPAVFVLSNGQRVEASDYFVTINSVQVNDEGKQRTIPLSTVNVQATVAANRERGLDIKIPDNKSQILISF